MFRSNEINHKDNWRKVSRRTEEFTAQNAPTVADYEYTYSKGLHLIGKQENGENRRTAYQYDSYYRLRRVDYDCAYSSSDPTCATGRNNVFKCNQFETDCEDFQLDGVHNIRASRENQTDFSWTVDGFNRLTQKSWNNESITYTYDSNNNMTGEDLDGDQNADIAYTYDKLNRLTSVTNADYLVEYSYDPFNRRTEKTVYYTENSDTFERTHKYAYDGWDIISEEIKTVRTSDNPATTTAWQIRRYVDQGTDNHIIMDTVSCSDDGNGNCSPNESTLQRIWFHKDERGNVIAISDGNGTIYERYRYRVYGEHEVLNADFSPKSTAAVSPFLWGGSLYEPETNLYWMRNRYYHIDMHRFINQDPIGIWGDANNLGNGFAYVAGMVIEASDPSGLDLRIFIFREFSTNFGIFGTLVVLDDEEVIFTAKVFEGRREKNKPAFSENISFLGKLQNRKFNDTGELYPIRPRIRLLEEDHISIGRQIHQGFLPSNSSGCFLIANEIINQNPKSEKDQIFDKDDSEWALSTLTDIIENLGDPVEIIIDPENNQKEELDYSSGIKQIYPNNATQKCDSIGCWCESGDCSGTTGENIPLDPDLTDGIQTYFANQFIKKILEMHEKKSFLEIMEEEGAVIKYDDNGKKVFIFNPYYIGKDPMKETIWEKQNADGTRGFVRNPFAAPSEYNPFISTADTWFNSNFNPGNIDPYWY